MPQLIVRSGSRAAQTIVLLSGVFRLGRNPTNDYSFDDATVSGWHCELIVEDATVRVRDLSSTNGTYIDSQRIKEAVLLPAQTLQLGSVEIVYDAAPGHVAIPELTFQQPGPFLADGLAACFNHLSSHATMECAQCHKTFCELCVHQVRRVGGVALTLCPVCGSHCQPVVRERAEKKKKSRLSSWIGKITAKMTARLTKTSVSEP